LEVLRMGGITMNDSSCTVAFHGSTWGAEIDEKIQEYFIQHFGYAPPLIKFHHHDCHAASSFYASGFEEALVVSIDNSGDGISTQISTGQ
jgi:carbamoyltransferase